MSKKKTGAEILKEDAAEMEAEEKALLADAVPRTPFEAAIDRATGFKADSGTEKADSETEKAETGTEKRDWVDDAYKCFIKNAEGLDPTDPVAAVGAYFEKNATDELKEQCKAEGKTPETCWKFIEAVARKVGGNCHIDPGAVYAMCMHYFQDVPADWDERPKPVASAPSPAPAPKPKPKKKPAAKKPKKPKSEQGFFFDLLATGGEEGGQQ